MCGKTGQEIGPTMTDSEYIAYFGYGSLVNRATHRTRIVDAVPARLDGWRRSWRPRADTSVFDVAILSVTREPASTTRGLLVIDRIENLPSIDERERHYDRVLLDQDEIAHGAELPPDCPVYVYEVPDTPDLSFGTQRILRSYLDAVLQGYLKEHGESSVRQFVEETVAFEIGILDDRSNPLYQRNVTLSGFEQALFDDVLSHLPNEIR